jgi:hypothetical protein
MSFRGILPYLAIFAALSGYLFYRMQTGKMPPGKSPEDARPRGLGRARRRLRIARDWDSLGHRDKKDTH